MLIIRRHFLLKRIVKRLCYEWNLIKNLWNYNAKVSTIYHGFLLTANISVVFPSLPNLTCINAHRKLWISDFFLFRGQQFFSSVYFNAWIPIVLIVINLDWLFGHWVFGVTILLGFCALCWSNWLKVSKRLRWKR